jgi:hypothetical protein
MVSQLSHTLLTLNSTARDRWLYKQASCSSLSTPTLVDVRQQPPQRLLKWAAWLDCAQSLNDADEGLALDYDAISVGRISHQPDTRLRGG